VLWLVCVHSQSPYRCPKQQEENPVLRLVRVYSLGLESGAVPPALLPLLARHLAPLLRALKHAASASDPGTLHPFRRRLPAEPFCGSPREWLRMLRTSCRTTIGYVYPRTPLECAPLPQSRPTPSEPPRQGLLRLRHAQETTTASSTRAQH
jgi:hypothetical protein